MSYIPFVLEPKLDGQRAQIHVREGRAVSATAAAAWICAEGLRLIGTIGDPDVIRKILAHLGVALSRHSSGPRATPAGARGPQVGQRSLSRASERLAPNSTESFRSQTACRCCEPVTNDAPAGP